ncbi:MAG TPA: AAA family ATPase [Roseiarcus sp.]|nr:AAA family ATPase [Roseiarcus sp.]
MLKSIQVSNFRSLHEAKVQKLKRLNLVTGSNGGGKTSLLEAVFLNAGAANAALVFSINGFRGDNVITPESDRVFRSWFWQLDPKNRIQITSDAVAHARTRSRTLLIDPLLRSQVTPGRSESETIISGMRFNFTGPSGKAISSAQINVPAPPSTPVGQPQTQSPQLSPISIEGPQTPSYSTNVPECCNEQFRCRHSGWLPIQGVRRKS